MQRNRRATLCKSLKWSLPSSVFFIFSLMNIATTHGMKASHLSTHFLNPFDTPIPTTIISHQILSTPDFTPMDTPIANPNLTPTPSPLSTSTSIITQTPIAIQTLQPQLTPTDTILPVHTMMIETPTIATPTSTLTSLSPTTIPTLTSNTLTMKTTSTNQPLSNTREKNKVLNTFLLPLSIGTPLLLASGWLFWLIRRRQINQPKQAQLGTSDKLQLTLWMRDHKLDTDLYALNYAIGASGTWPIPAMPQIPDMSPPIVSLNTPLLDMPSLLRVQPVVSQPTHPPSIKNDPLLGEIMRQAQMGLFVVSDRE